MRLQETLIIQEEAKENDTSTQTTDLKHKVIEGISLTDQKLEPVQEETLNEEFDKKEISLEA